MPAAKFLGQKVALVAHSFRLGAARRGGLRKSLRGKRVGNFLYNGRGKETR